MLFDLGRNWGATIGEHARAYPADELLSGPRERLTRAVPVHAPAELTYRWLCQLSVAPYSYDLLDNRGRRSPRQLTPGAEWLRVGQRVLVCELTEVEPGRGFSGRSYREAERRFGPLAITYRVEPTGAHECRLIVRLVLSSAGTAAAVRARLLTVGDLIMMRKQLLTLKRLAERDAAETARSGLEQQPAP